MPGSLLPNLSLLAAFSSCLLAVFLLTVKTARRLPNALLAAFILLNAADVGAWLLNGWLLPYPRLLLFKITLNLLINPAFYLYVMAVCYADFRLRARHLVHLAPFGLFTVGLLPGFYLASKEAQLYFLRHYSTMPVATAGRVLGQLLFGFYTVAAFRTLARYQRTYVENYADPASKTYRWLWRLALGLTGLHVLVLGKELLRYTPYHAVFQGLEIWVGLSATAGLGWWLLQALYHPQLFRGISSQLAPVEQPRATAPATGLSPGPPAASPATAAGPAALADAAALAQRLRAHMAQAQPYLDPALTIQDLAQQLQVPARELSLLINHHLDQHFFDFVNEHRIQQSMRLLKDPSQRGLTVLEILYAVGFNSKSSFNTAFKKLTGQTPTQYRRA